MRLDTHFGADEGTCLTLRHAILLYGDEQTTVATVHGVQELKGGPALLEGAPLERKEFLAIARRLSESKAKAGGPRKLLDPGVLLAEPDMLAWWRPSQRRAIFFKTTEPRLNALSGKAALHPPLLFVAKEPRDLYVYALSSDERPTEKTRLARAPYFNVYANSHLCEGNFKLPDHFRPEGIPTWERAFFDTNFSHTPLSEKSLTKYPGGHAALWEAMCANGRQAAKAFPAPSLAPLKSGERLLTLGQVIGE